uniref:Small G protein signaling modulator 1 n=1 Tax=Cacopsylla melanoneura TaxID=428564 RepID=A0A8D8Q3K9_9HEMI
MVQIMTADQDKDVLIRNVKKEVKQIMEEAVTRKFVHQDSGTITSFCGAVEACLSQGLRRRALGLFKTSSTTALLHKIGKYFEPAGLISQKVQELEGGESNRRLSSSGEQSKLREKPPLLKKTSSSGSNAAPAPLPKNLWIRLALFERVLASIIDYLVQNASKYYEADSLVADQDCGSILSSLLVGPCALEYSRSKTSDHYWTDPPADELLQRHRISTTPPSTRRTQLNQYGRSLNAKSSEEIRQQPSVASAKDYVESLHQNTRATLLYGKNNVMVCPKDVPEPMAGYLSLHQASYTLMIKWTPNQLMNGYCDDSQDKSMYWDYAINLNLDEVVYVHCHQKSEGEHGGTIVLVGQDGVQRSPIIFPKGGHLLAFLSCLENGLLPHGQLDPPLWSQRGKGKVFPRLRRNSRLNLYSTETEAPAPTEEGTIDYVFQIINKKRREDIMGSHELWQGPTCGSPRAHLASTSSSSTTSNKSISIDHSPLPLTPPPHILTGNFQTPTNAPSGTSLQILCDTMKRQIISRAFYGWLAYCRHLRTVRTHLSGLVHMDMISGEGTEGGVTRDIWAGLMREDGYVDDAGEVFRLAYYGGVASELRKEVWPFLLGHHTFHSTREERIQKDLDTKQSYETTMSEWLAVEAIVRQKDKEVMAVNLAKLSNESTSGTDSVPLNLPILDNNLSNDVFEDNMSSLSDDSDEAPVVDEYEDALDSNPEPLQPGDEQSHTQPDEQQQAKVLIESDPASKVSAGKKPPHQDSLSSTTTRSDSPDEGMGDDMEEEDSKPGGSKNDGQTDDEHSPRTNDVPSCTEQNSSGPNDAKPPQDQETGSPLIKTCLISITSNQSMDSGHMSSVSDTMSANEQAGPSQLTVCMEGEENFPGRRSSCISPVSSNGGVYTTELLESFGLNLHRIDKDVLRCDRNYYYFTPENLDKLRNIMCTYVWEHLDVGYMQGMCDLVAPLLVILDEESLTYACFCCLMDRMAANFPTTGGLMDNHFANMRSLIQILDAEMFELMQQNGDYTHFYFCYRWFLLDFKRELVYDDVFRVWESIWAAQQVSSAHFNLFIALALVELYRDIILANTMDFTDIIKFFNEMAERHDAKAVLSLARDLVLQLQTLIDNK